MYWQRVWYGVYSTFTNGPNPYHFYKVINFRIVPFCELKLF